jgi:hypothetical protein
VHKFVTHHSRLIEEDEHHFIVQISKNNDAPIDEVINSHFLQLLHDFELRQEIEKSTGKIL